MRIVRSHFRSRFALCSELCVQNSCVQPAAMPASVIRIGKVKFGYVYTYVGDGTYKCERGSDWCLLHEVLWLRKETDGLWYAFDGPKHGAIPTFVPHDKVRFKSADTNANIPGWHTWAMTMSDDEEGSFETTKLSD